MSTVVCLVILKQILIDWLRGWGFNSYSSSFQAKWRKLQLVLYTLHVECPTSCAPHFQNTLQKINSRRPSSNTLAMGPVKTLFKSRSLPKWIICLKNIDGKQSLGNISILCLNYADAKQNEESYTLWFKQQKISFSLRRFLVLMNNDDKSGEMSTDF